MVCYHKRLPSKFPRATRVGRPGRKHTAIGRPRTDEGGPRTTEEDPDRTQDSQDKQRDPTKDGKTEPKMERASRDPGARNLFITVWQTLKERQVPNSWREYFLRSQRTTNRGSSKEGPQATSSLVTSAGRRRARGHLGHIGSPGTQTPLGSAYAPPVCHTLENPLLILFNRPAVRFKNCEKAP